MDGTGSIGFASNSFAALFASYVSISGFELWYLSDDEFCISGITSSVTHSTISPSFWGVPNEELPDKCLKSVGWEITGGPIIPKWI